MGLSCEEPIVLFLRRGYAQSRYVECHVYATKIFQIIGCSLNEGREKFNEIGLRIKGLTVRYKKSEAKLTFFLHQLRLYLFAGNRIPN